MHEAKLCQQDKRYTDTVLRGSHTIVLLRTMTSFARVILHRKMPLRCANSRHAYRQ